MSFKSALLYYKDLRPSNLTTTRYRFLLLALYWPFFGLLFMAMENWIPVIWKAMTGNELVYHEVVCALDAYIPFCELFALPYYFWFAYMVGLALYALLFEHQMFREFMWFVILTYSVTAVIYLAWPNMQALRPAEFPRDNLFTDIIRGLYGYDTNTNVCPSIHVLGSMAVCLPGLRSKTLRGWGWKVFFIVSNVLICMSTVFLKQHSIIDVFVALGLTAVCYPLVAFVICRRNHPDEIWDCRKEADSIA